MDEPRDASKHNDAGDGDNRGGDAPHKATAAGQAQTPGAQPRRRIEEAGVHICIRDTLIHPKEP